VNCGLLTILLIFQSPDDDMREYGAAVKLYLLDKTKELAEKKTCLSATLFTTRTDVKLNPALRGKRPAPNLLSYSTAV
jgi:hypothetical protein